MTIETATREYADLLSTYGVLLDDARYEVEKGRKFSKIVKHDAHGKSAVVFVEISTGDIYDAMSWHKRASFPRGNVLREVA